MGVFVEWCAPHEEAPYDETRIYRGSSQAGPFTLLTTITDITKTGYYDITGTSSNWYQVEFFDQDTLTPSSKSDPLQAGQIVGYCTPEDLEDFTNLDTTDITSEEYCRIIPLAGAQLNHDIQTYHFEEEVLFIDDTKENNIDGVNTTFYVKHFHIGDATGDLEVTVGDIEVIRVDKDGVRNVETVSSINPTTGQFVLATAPTAANTNRLLVTYYDSPLSVNDPHPLVRLACIYLVASIAYSKINIGKATTVKFGSQTFVRHMKSYAEYFAKYKKIIHQINNRMAKVGQGVEIPKGFGTGGFYP